jgi:hypothetical protein
MSGDYGAFTRNGRELIPCAAPIEELWEKSLDSTTGDLNLCFNQIHGRTIVNVMDKEYSE